MKKKGNSTRRHKCIVCASATTETKMVKGAVWDLDVSTCGTQRCQDTRTKALGLAVTPGECYQCDGHGVVAFTDENDEATLVVCDYCDGVGFTLRPHVLGPVSPAIVPLQHRH